MSQSDNQSGPVWNESLSRTFLDVGRYYVPDRERQIKLICDLIPARPERVRILELCCGEGLLAEALLSRWPAAEITALDGSAEMLARARTRLAPMGSRASTGMFDLGAADWRKLTAPVDAVVSSLAIHHLDGEQKRQLFADVFRMLSHGGVFVIADLILPDAESALALAADEWDETVRERSLSIDGNMAAYERFRESQENIFRYPDPMDKPSPLFDQMKWLEQAGFEHVDVFWIKAGHAIFGGRKT